MALALACAGLLLAPSASHALDGAVQSFALGRFAFERGVSLDDAHVTCFPVADAEYERGFLSTVVFTPVPSIWGHAAGGGGNPADAAFVSTQIAVFPAR